MLFRVYPVQLLFNKLKMRNSKNNERRMVAAESALLCTVFIIAMLSLTPEFRDYAIILAAPFLVYGLYFVIDLNQK